MTTTQTTQLRDAAIAACEAAKEWDWDWTTEVGSVTDPETGEEETIYASSASDDVPEDCRETRDAYTAGVAETVAECDAHLDRAIEALRRGEFAEALGHAEAACGAESEYGDCPACRPAREAIEALIAVRRGRRSRR